MSDTEETVEQQQQPQPLQQDQQQFQQQPHTTRKPRKRAAGASHAVEELKLNGLDRTPGWHKIKNLPSLAHLNSWVSRCFFYISPFIYI